MLDCCVTSLPTCVEDQERGSDSQSVSGSSMSSSRFSCETFSTWKVRLQCGFFMFCGVPNRKGVGIYPLWIVRLGTVPVGLIPFEVSCGDIGLVDGDGEIRERGSARWTKSRLCRHGKFESIFGGLDQFILLMASDASSN